MTPEEEALLERVTSAWRPKARDGTVVFHPSWHDLTDEARAMAFSITGELRTMEAAMDPDGLSSTGHAVLSKIRKPGI